MNSRALRLTVILVVAVALLFLAFRGVHLEDMLATITHVRPEILMLGWLVYTASTFLRGLRWRVLLSAAADVSPLTAFLATSLGYLANQFLPARAGELIRSIALGRRTELGTSYVLATALTERVTDALVLVVVGLVAVSAIPDVPLWLLAGARATAVVAVVGAIAMVILSRNERFVVVAVNRLPVPDRHRQLVRDVVARFLFGLNAVQHPGRAVAFAGLTAAIWFSDSVAASIVARSLGLDLPLPQAILLLAALGLASAAPLTPGFLGIYQFVGVSLLPIFGFSRSDALAYIIVLQGTSTALFLVWGSWGAWQLGVSWHALRRGPASGANGPPDAQLVSSGAARGASER